MKPDVYPAAPIRTPGEGGTQNEAGQPDPVGGGGARIDRLAPETYLIRSRARRRWLQRKKQRPWLRCLKCGRRLVPITVFEGWTRIAVGHAYTEGDPKLICPRCFTIRRFESRSL